MTKGYLAHQGKFYLLFIVLILAGSFYVVNTWSPSSYGIVLSQIGASGEGLISGTPKLIRSDEWAVLTPQIQALVNNHYQRINETSYYHEDLRHLISMPVDDWGLFFKPQVWGFYFLSPAYAYSLYWYLCFAFFIAGYALLFCRYKIADFEFALLSSILLYFSGAIQTWWTVFSGILGIFPWVLLAATELNIKNSVVKFIIMYWVFTCWLFSFFYPPFYVSFAFVGLICILSFRRDVLNKYSFMMLGIVVILAILTAILYFQNYIISAWNSVYPGKRSVSGGGVLLSEIITMLIPGIDGIVAIKKNICEAATVGSYLLLYLLFFLDYRSIAEKIIADIRAYKLNTEMILLVGVITLLAWVLLPVPRELGAFLLFDRVPPGRMKFAVGLLCYVLLLFMYSKYGLKYTLAKWLALGVVVLAFLTLIEMPILMWQDRNQMIVAFLVFLYAMFVSIFYHITGSSGKWLSFKIPMVLVLAAQLMLFGLYNPIQSTKPIFSVPNTKIIERLRGAHKKLGYIEEVGFRGSILNGLGFRSISHVLEIPILSYWHKKYSYLSGQEIDILFNRYVQIQVSPSLRAPMLAYFNAVLIPKEGKRFEKQLSYIVLPSRKSPCRFNKCQNGGYIERAYFIQVSEGKESDIIALPATGLVSVTGYVANTSTANKLIIVSDVSIKHVEISQIDALNPVGFPGKKIKFIMQLWISRNDSSKFKSLNMLVVDNKGYKQLDDLHDSVINSK